MLSQNKLSTEIESALSTPPTDIPDFANLFSTAYKNYCIDAVDISGDSLLTTGEQAMESILLALDAPNNTLDIYCDLVEQSVIAFWTNSAFSLTTPPAGMSQETSVVITPMLLGSIKGSLLSLVETGQSKTIQDSALDHAQVIHSATLTVMTTHTGPSVVPPFPPIVVGPSPIT